MFRNLCWIWSETCVTTTIRSLRLNINWTTELVIMNLAVKEGSCVLHSLQSLWWKWILSSWNYLWLYCTWEHIDIEIRMCIQLCTFHLAGWLLPKGARRYERTQTYEILKITWVTHYINTDLWFDGFLPHIFTRL